MAYVEIDLLETARTFYLNGDLDMARLWYQKVGYDVGINPERYNKELVTKEIAAFAAEDPLSQHILSVITQIILQQKKPILQSEITKAVKEQYGDKAAELVRYATYFAEVRGELHREKKGRSYLLYLVNPLSQEEMLEVIHQQYEAAKNNTTPPQEELLSSESTGNKKWFWLWVGLGLLCVQLYRYFFK